MQEQRESEGSWRIWEPELALRSFALNEVRFSKGFLQADLRSWFHGLKAHWVPLFHTLGADVEIESVEAGFVFPEGLERIVAFDIDNELAVFGIAERSAQHLVDIVVGGCDERAADVILEYLQRRFLASVTRSWSGSVPLNCAFSSSSASQDVEVSGVIRIELKVNGEACEFWIGVGPSVLERFDQTYKEQRNRTPSSGETHVLSVEIAELAVPPEMLVDYLRAGTVIGLDLPVSTEVLIRRDGVAWALGRLGQFNGRFAVEIVEREGDVTPPQDALTRLQVEIARVELDAGGVEEHSQIGAIFLTRTPVASTASLVIGGEPVATALVGELDGQFALSVSPT